jgi:hypothetical protein
MASNTFSNMSVAISLMCDADPHRLVAGSMFENVSSFLVSKRKEVRVELALTAVQSATGEGPEEVIVECAGLPGPLKSGAWNGSSQLRPLSRAYIALLSPVVLGMHPNGTLEELAVLSIRVYVLYMDGTPRNDIVRAFPVRADNSWTEYVE